MTWAPRVLDYATTFRILPRPRFVLSFNALGLSNREMSAKWGTARMPDQRDELDPWRVIVSSLFDHIESFDVPQIIDRAGLSVNWSLTDQENYSHTYRKAAYRPRINQAYEALSNEDRLRVAYFVANELICLGHSETLDAALRRIGWCIQSDRLTPTDADVRELFFPTDTQHDAYVAIREKFALAQSSLKVIDSYLDATIFRILAGISSTSLQVDLLTANVPTDFTDEAGKFLSQYRTFELDIRKSRDFHDRFIIIDNNACWHIGCSLKDAGNRAFMLSKIEDETNRDALLEALSRTWSEASQIFP